MINISMSMKKKFFKKKFVSQTLVKIILHIRYSQILYFTNKIY